MTTKPTIILLMSRDEQVVNRLRQVFEGARPLPIELITVDSLREAQLTLGQIQFDAAVLDLSIPEASIEQALTRIREVAPNLATVLLADSQDEETAREGLKLGAQDYLLKNMLEENHMKHIVSCAIARQRHGTQKDKAQSEELAMKDRFLSHVSHELRSPLASLHQFTTIIRDGIAGDINATQGHYLDICCKNIAELKRMIDDLLNVSRAQVGNFTIQPLRISCSDRIAESLTTLHSIAVEHKINLTADIEPHLPYIYADPDLVRQVLSNLILNAIKFTPPGGTITIRARVYSESNDFIYLEVEDTGPGIEPEDQSRVFDYMYQAENTPYKSRKGLGLGLTICKQLVTMHGGAIWLTSTRGEGTTMSFTMPVFAARRFVSPLAGTTSGAAEKWSLISIALAYPEKVRAAESLKDVLIQACEILKDCLDPARFAVIPSMSDVDMRSTIFVVRYGGQAEDTEVEHYIRERLSLAGGYEGVGVVLATVADVVQLRELGADEEEEETELDRAASELERLMQVHELGALREKVMNANAQNSMENAG